MSPTLMKMRAALAGLIACVGLFAMVFAIAGIASGPRIALQQFRMHWGYIVTLAAGFALQIGLYAYLRLAVAEQARAKRAVAASGATSTAAMISCGASCCVQPLTNLLPVLGATGLATLAAEYQVELFWLGFGVNLAGIAYVARRIRQTPRVSR